ncbi:hypothetical protein KR093_004037, partial [Drosophila rubida]
APVLILFGYLADALVATRRMRMESYHMAMLANDWQLIGLMYMLLDVAIILTGCVLIGFSWRDARGVALLMLQRTLRTLIFSIWNYAVFLHYVVDVGCLLMLLANRQSQRQKAAFERQREKDERRLQILILVARICMSCVCLSWIVENHLKPLAVVWFVLMVLGIRCKLLASLTIVPLMCQEYGWLIWGWDDFTISMQFTNSLIGKAAAFLLMTLVGGGKWSLE